MTVSTSHLMDAPAPLARQHALALQWIRLLDKGLAALDSGLPDALQSLAGDEAAILESMQAQRAAATDLRALPARSNDLGEDRLRDATRQALLRALELNRQFASALQAREQLAAARLQALCSAAGMTGVYSGAGQMAPPRPAGRSGATA